VVGITVHLTFALRAYDLAAWYRNRGAKVVLGGLHVTSCPDEAARHGDAIAIGEGVQLWPEILADAAADALKPVYRGSFRQPYREDPPPHRDLVARDSYLTTTSVIASRGCKNRCDFCYLATGDLAMPYQVRDPERLAAEIAADEQPYFVFTDNNLGASRPYLRRLCAALEPLGKIWSAAVSLDVTDDPSLVREMALAGCTGVFVGLESLDPKNLSGAHKRTPQPAEFGPRVRCFHDHGIQVNGSFVFGFDHDRPDVFERTVDWIERHRLECATFHILTPYPGTPLFAKLKREGRILHTDWQRYDTSHVVFRPRRMTAEQLCAGYRWSYRRLFSPTSIWRRRPADGRAVLPYLGMSLLYKHANPLWLLLIQQRLTAPVWRPFVEYTRRRHLARRRRLAQTTRDVRPQGEPHERSPSTHRLPHSRLLPDDAPRPAGCAERAGDLLAG
jgi:radical SAM superfamily enzyme YgiQ (UPF0313 family)